VIGITAYHERASWGSWLTEASLVPDDYVRSLASLGANPVILPVYEQPEDTLDSLVRRLDGLILTGGPDVDPARYGAEPHPRSQLPRVERDDREVALLGAAERCGLPVLAICRGTQLLNVAHGGTLIQHLPDVVGHEQHSPTPGAMAKHRVRIAPDSLLHQILGWDERDVPTHHHQAVERLADDLTAVAWADDGTIEAVESTSTPFLVGVQWHAESDDDMSVLEALVREAAGLLAIREADLGRTLR
jgi:gamma-glutamyl-gamma-aminobutyrate hydrolase PuuD